MAIDTTRAVEGINVAKEGLDLIKDWERASHQAIRARIAHKEADEVLKLAEGKLAKWMLPHDAKPGEKFGVWVGNDLIQVEAAGSCPNDDHIITIRQRTK